MPEGRGFVTMPLLSPPSPSRPLPSRPPPFAVTDRPPSPRLPRTTPNTAGDAPASHVDPRPSPPPSPIAIEGPRVADDPPQPSVGKPATPRQRRTPRRRSSASGAAERPRGGSVADAEAEPSRRPSEQGGGTPRAGARRSRIACSLAAHHARAAAGCASDAATVAAQASEAATVRALTRALKCARRWQWRRGWRCKPTVGCSQAAHSHLQTHAPTHPRTHPLTHAPTHPRTHPRTYAPTPPRTPPRARSPREISGRCWRWAPRLCSRWARWCASSLTRAGTC